MSDVFLAKWRDEFVETDHEVTTEEMDSLVAASDWAKEYAIVVGGYWLFGSVEALEKFEDDLHL